MKTFFVLFLSLSAFEIVSAQKVLTIEMAAKPVIADGFINASDPWNENNWIDVTEKAPGNSTTNMSAQFQLMYDRENLYFGIKVIDNNRFTGNSTTYNNDCVELFIAMDTATFPTGAYRQAGDKHMRMQAVADPNAPGGIIECEQLVLSSGTYRCIDNGSFYVQEWVMPWELLTADMDPAWDKKQFKFEVQVANATGDGMRTQQMFWNDNSDFQWNNTNKFGVALLISPLAYGVEIGPDKTITCGDSVKFNPGVSYLNSGEVTFSWSPAEGLSATDILKPVAFTKTNKKYILTMSTPDLGITKDSVLIKVNPLKATVNDILVPCGNPGQFNVTTNSGLKDLNYNWTPVSGLSFTDIPNPVVNVSSNTDYSVEVITPGGCSSTDIASVNLTSIAYNPLICMVSVDENDHNIVVIEKEQHNAAEAFFIYRESSLQTDQFDLIGTLPYSENGVYVDMESNAKVHSNKYKIAVKDKCGFVTVKSSAHKTMHLTINKGTGNNWNLIWEPYNGVPVSNYTIYRGISRSSLEQIGSVAGGNSTFTDLNAPTGNVYYQLEVVLPQPCNTLKATEYTGVRSNIVSNFDATNGILTNTLSGGFLYPNPATDKLYFKPGYQENAHIVIYTILGEMVFDRKVSEQIDISGLSKGVYLAKLIQTGNVVLNKLVIK